MRILHHAILSPSSRKIRLQLTEKKLSYTLELERPWEAREPFLTLSPAGDVPVLRDEGGVTVNDAGAVAEYLEEVYPQPPLLPKSPAARAEVRRVAAWFDAKFDREAGWPLVREKVFKRFGWLPGASSAPDMTAIRLGMDAMKAHLDYAGRLADRRGWLCGELSLADMAAAAHFSCVDYLGDVPWDDFPAAKDWYMRIKSRPCFRPLLSDRLPGLNPADGYADLDF